MKAKIDGLIDKRANAMLSMSGMGVTLTDKVPLIFNNGRDILLNPETFFIRTFKERSFMVVHEILSHIYEMQDADLIERMCNLSNEHLNPRIHPPEGVNEFKDFPLGIRGSAKDDVFGDDQ